MSYFSKILLLSVALVGLVEAFTFTVTVGIDETDGKQGLGFDPSVITPAAGDTIAFTFQLPSYIKDPTTVKHSATQSSFDSPCVPKEGGFDTGLQDTGSENTNTGATFNLIVNDTQPLWFFSSTNNDCKSGMVLAVNPPASGQSAAAFKQNAEDSTEVPSTTAQPTPGASDGLSSSPVAPSASSPTGSNAPQSNGALSRGTRFGFVYAGIVAFFGSSFVL